MSLRAEVLNMTAGKAATDTLLPAYARSESGRSRWVVGMPLMNTSPSHGWGWMKRPATFVKVR